MPLRFNEAVVRSRTLSPSRDGTAGGLARLQASVTPEVMGTIWNNRRHCRPVTCSGRWGLSKVPARGVRGSGGKKTATASSLMEVTTPQGVRRCPRTARTLMPSPGAETPMAGVRGFFTVRSQRRYPGTPRHPVPPNGGFPRLRYFNSAKSSFEPERSFLILSSLAAIARVWQRAGGCIILSLLEVQMELHHP